MAQQETSALFSLKELMRIEESRIEEERAQKQRQAQAAERARLEAARVAREKELARARFEEERRREEEQRAREEAARIEALRLAEIERARIDAMERAKGDALSVQRAHEQRLAAIGAVETRKRLRWTMGFGAATFVALAAAGAGVYFGQIKPNADERTRGLQAIIAQRRAETEQMQRALDDQNHKVRALEDQMKSDKDAPASPPAASAKLPSTKPARPHAKEKVRPPPASCTCDPHDPLCGCFAPR